MISRSLPFMSLLMRGRPFLPRIRVHVCQAVPLKPTRYGPTHRRLPWFCGAAHLTSDRRPERLPAQRDLRRPRPGGHRRGELELELAMSLSLRRSGLRRFTELCQATQPSADPRQGSQRQRGGKVAGMPPATISSRSAASLRAPRVRQYHGSWESGEWSVAGARAGRAFSGRFTHKNRVRRS